jgi:hypothetical protein
MAGIRGRSGRPGNQNAFSHGLAGIAQPCADGVLNPAEQSVREEICPAYCLISGQLRRSVPLCACWRRLSRAIYHCWSFNRVIAGIQKEAPSRFGNFLNLRSLSISGQKCFPVHSETSTQCSLRRKIKSSTKASYGRARRRRIRT